MIISDFHTHSSNSGDCDEKMQSQIEAALNKGIKHLCITDHNDFDYPDPLPKYIDESCSFLLDVDTYYNEYLKMKDKYCTNSSNDFNLYFGVELGMQLQVVEENKILATKYPFDFIIASSHVLYHEDPYYPEFYEGRSEIKINNDYFESIYENICEFNDFDVYGHLDYIFRYGKTKTYNFNDYRDVIEPILKKIVSMGKGIEINTCGLRNNMKYPNPSPEILKMYKDLGGEIITVGSDAHSSKHVAWEFNIAESILKNCGFEYYTIFKNRKPDFLKL